MSIWKHADWWGAPPQAKVSLGEGGTPLIRSVRLGREGANPTGSYKDRFAAAAVSHLQRDGKKICLGTSSGNTGAALAAYCARAEIACVLAIVEGAPEGKLRQMLAYGAHLFRIKNFGSSPSVNSEVINGLRGLAGDLGAGFEISAFACSPRGMSGVQTLGFEIAEAFSSEGVLGADTEINVFSPAGGGGLTLAVARGFTTAAAHGAWPGRARIHCVQPAGNDTMATALRDGSVRARAVESRTAISGLQVGSVIDGDAVIEACRRSGGQGHAVTDERVWEWQGRLARAELHPDDTVVCLVTGSGFKDERSLVRMTGDNIAPLVDGFAAFAAKARSSLAAS